MFDFLIGNKTFQIIVIVIIVIVLVFLIKALANPKHKDFRKIVGVISLVVIYAGLIFSAYFSILKINKYYGTKGGIKGALDEIFKQNEVTIDTKELNFNFKNISLMQNEDNSYSAEFITSDVITLNADENYITYINDQPLITSVYSDDYMVSNYNYIFYNREHKEILRDELVIYISFYKNMTVINVTTDYAKTHDDSLAVDLWNSYFNKNSFVLKIKAENNAYKVKDTYKIQLFLDNELYKTINVIAGHDCILPTKFNFTGYNLNYWTYKNIPIKTIENVNQDYQLVAVYNIVDFYGLTDAEEKPVYTWEELKDKNYITVKDGKFICNNLNLAGKFYISPEVKSLSNNAFKNCEKLTDVFLPNTITEIGSSAFENCKNIKSILLPEGITKISASLFENCTSLTSVNIPNGVTEIGIYAFVNCISLKYLWIPKSVVNTRGYYINSASDMELHSPFNKGNRLTKIVLYAEDSEENIKFKGRPYFDDGSDGWCVFISSEYTGVEKINFGYTYTQYLEEIANKGETA